MSDRRHLNELCVIAQYFGGCEEVGELKQESTQRLRASSRWTTWPLTSVSR